ncbi:hypothetical protein SDC9_180425 [bioreactor metagenome]|uniref:Uncharacterized protein n=1 Tax=bioreactor metagenome TaxID=1076179 RepID=A0A645H3P3_9ZZZZ
MSVRKYHQWNILAGHIGDSRGQLLFHLDILDLIRGAVYIEKVIYRKQFLPLRPFDQHRILLDGVAFLFIGIHNRRVGIGIYIGHFYIFRKLPVSSHVFPQHIKIIFFGIENLDLNRRLQIVCNLLG